MLILSHAAVFEPAIEVPADAELVVDGLQELVHEEVHTVVVALQQLLCVEVGHSLTANGTSEHVLVGVDEGIDTGCTKLVDQSLDLVKVSVVVYASRALDSLPHNTETHKVHTPSLQVSDVLIIKRVLRVKVAIRWNIRVNLVDDINTMKEHLTALSVLESAAARVNIDAHI